tara:strand:+ start:1365 stop:1526 length:162 start_codon:yes stop_codon:yes gene_type:complete
MLDGGKKLQLSVGTLPLNAGIGAMAALCAVQYRKLRQKWKFEGEGRRKLTEPE